MAQDLEALLRDPNLSAILKLPQWTVAQTQLVAQAQQRSGLPVAVFCQRLGVKVWRLYKGRRSPGNQRPQLAEAAQVALPEPFVPVKLNPAAAASDSDRPCAEWVTPRGERLLLWATAPESWLKLLCQAMVPPC